MNKQGSAYAVLFVSALLAACNGGGDNNSSSSGGGGGGGSTPTPFQGFMAYTESFAGSSGFVVPASGSTAAVQLPAQNFPGILMANQISTNSAGVPTGVTHAAVAFVGTGNHWYSAQLTPGTTPTPVQIASDTLPATAPCRSFATTFGGSQTSIDVKPTVVYRDLTAGRSAFVVYSLGGPDGLCDTLDDITQIVNLQGNSTQSAITLPGVPVAAVYHPDGKLGGLLLFALDPTTGQQTGLGTLYFLSDTTNFTSPITLANNVFFLSVALNDASNTLLHGKQVFMVLITQNPNVPSGLYRLSDQGVLSAKLDSFQTFITQSFSVQSVADATNLYYFNGELLKSVPLDGSAQATTVGDYASGAVGYLISGQTQNNVVLSLNGSVFVVPKHGTADSTTPTGVTSTFALRFVAPDFLFLDGGSVPTQAVVTDENGTLVQTVSMGEWVGARYTPDLSGGVLPQSVPAGIIVSVATTQSPDSSNTSTVDFNNATFAELSLSDGKATNFTAADGTDATFSYVSGSFSYQSSVPVDDGLFMTVGGDTNVYKFDFLNHVIQALTDDNSTKSVSN